MHTAKAAIARIRRTYTVFLFQYKGHPIGWPRQWRTRGTQTTTREKTMNTIQVTNSMGQVVNYTEAEINTIIKNGATFAADTVKLSEDIRKIRHEVRDFFSEEGWDGGEQTVNKGDVNFLLERIGANKLTTVYRGSASISFTFEVDAEDEDQARDIVSEGASINEYGFEASGEEVEITDIDENY